MSLPSCISSRLGVAFILIIFSLMMLPEETEATAKEDFKEKPSAELLGRAESYIEADTLLDKAIAALSVVAQRYYSKPEDSAARRDAITAMYQLGNIYSLRIFDFPKAYTNLSTARMLAEEEGDDYKLASILLRLANIYNICYDEEDKKSTYSLLSEALDRAIAGNNEEVITRLAINMSIMQVLKGGWGEHAEKIARIRNYRFPSDFRNRMICVNIIDGMKAYFNGNFMEAENHYRKVLDFLPQDQNYKERYVYGTMYLLQYVYEDSGDYMAEEKLLRDRLRFIKKLSLDDYELYTYSHFVNFFKRRNQSDSVQKYYSLYLFKKEELDDNSGLSKVQNVEMLRQIEQANDEVRQLSLNKLKERRRLSVILAVSAVVFILLLTFIYLFLNLKRNHKLLFQKNRELLEREEQLKMLMSHNGEDADVSHDSSVRKEDNAADCEADEESSLLFPRILKVMEEDRAIYGQGFGADDLAAILHVPQRSVSRAINACSGMNFHQFLNG